MTEYTYTSPDGCKLTVTTVGEGESPALLIDACECGPEVPVADVPELVRVILAQTANVQGRDYRDPLKHIRDDLELAGRARESHGTFAMAAVDAASRRVVDEHLPMLYALASAFLGDDAPIRAELVRVQRERDFARERAEAYKAERDRARAANERLRVEAARLRAAWHSARGRARSYLATGSAATRRAVSWMSYANDAEAAIRKDRAELGRLRRDRDSWQAETKRARAEAEQLRAENTELREGLPEIQAEVAETRATLDASRRLVDQTQEMVRRRAVDRAYVLREAVCSLRLMHPAVYADAGQRTAEGILRAADELERQADAAESTPVDRAGAEAPA